jgi:peptide deformylase
MLDLIYVPDELLTQKAEAVGDINGEVSEMAAEMIEAMHNGKGIGLAGPQVGRLQRLFVTHVPDDIPRVFINPEIIGTSMEEGVYEEGCLSIPGIYADVKRPSSIQVQAWNERGRPFSLDVRGLLARVILHEYDHLNGVLFLDHLKEKTREKLMKKYERVKTPG